MEVTIMLVEFFSHHLILEEGIDRQRDGHGVSFASLEDEDRGSIGMGVNKPSEIGGMEAKKRI